MFAKWCSQAWRCVGRGHWATVGWDADCGRSWVLIQFWSQALGDRRGAVEWSKVMELLAVNRLCAPGSELSIHERWFSRTAMDFLLGCDEAVAGKDRLYRALDKALEHRDALMGHLQERWSDLFGAECQILLYDLTSTYFEGEAEGVESAARGYSRDHRPDTLQVIVALVVTPEGFPVAYEVFDGDTADVTTLEEIVDKIENKYGMRGRVWVFDRGIVSEDNLQDLRQRGAYYLVGTPRRKLADFERELLEGDWQEIAGKPGVRVQLLLEGGETFVLARSLQRAKKESAILRSQLTRLHRSLRALGRVVAARRAQGLGQNRTSAWPSRRALSPRLVHAQRESNTAAAGCCGLGIRRACGEPSCVRAPICCAPISIPWIPTPSGVNTCSLPKWKLPSVPSKANWPSVRSGTASSAASRPIS